MAAKRRLFFAAMATLLLAPQAGASSGSGCAAVADPVAARICRVNDEIARVDVRPEIRPLRCSLRGTPIETRACRVAAKISEIEASQGLVQSTSGPGVATGPTFAGARVTPDQRLAILKARRQLLEVAQARIALGNVGSDQGLLFLAPVVLLLLILAGGGDGEPISPS